MPRDLKHDLTICNAATPGPWEWLEDRFNGGYGGIVGRDEIEVLYPNHRNEGDDGDAWFEDFPTEEDRVFFTEARQGWPESINRALAAEAELSRIKLGMGNDYGDDPVKFIQALKQSNDRLKSDLRESQELSYRKGDAIIKQVLRRKAAEAEVERLRTIIELSWQDLAFADTDTAYIEEACNRLGAALGETP